MAMPEAKKTTKKPAAKKPAQKPKAAPKKETKSEPKSDKFAVIKTGGKQYVVREGLILDIEKIEGDEGKAVVFEEVLLVADGTNVKIGTPKVDTKVSGKIQKQFQDKKVKVFKYKPKKRVRKTYGHRQEKTKRKISKIAEEAVKAKMKEIEAQIEDTQKDIGFHGNDSDGWHGEAYQLMMVEYFGLTSKLHNLKRQLHESEVLENIDDSCVSEGTRVSIEIDGTKKEYIFDGISYGSNVITPESPIGKAISGKKPGQEVEYTTTSGQKTVKIIEII